MGLRFRRSFKLAPGIRANVTKKGVGFSFGGKGHSVSVHSSGRVTSTVGIPGSGLSYTTTSGGSSGGGAKKHRENSAPSPSSGKKHPINLVILALAGLAGVGIMRLAGGNAEPTPTTVPSAPAVVATEGAVPTPTLEDGISEIYADIISIDHTDTKDTPNAVHMAIYTDELQSTYDAAVEEDQEAIQAWEEKRDKIVEAASQLDAVLSEHQEDRTLSLEIRSADEETVYFTLASGKLFYDALAMAPKEAQAAANPTTKPGQSYVLNTSSHVFHSPTCSSVDKIKDKNRSSAYGTREEIMARGYKPCGVCHP